jgi:hypothetical protein
VDGVTGNWIRVRTASCCMSSDSPSNETTRRSQR